ncbi:M1 family aminopeptidase [Bacteroidota bacterium]
MKHTLLIIALLIVNITISNSSQIQTYEELRDQLRSLKPDASKIAIIEGMFWEKENGFITLESGKIYFFKPLNGRTCVAVFIGKGSFAFQPPTIVEKLQLERFYDTQFLEKPIRSIVMYFTDDTYEFIRSNFMIQSGRIDDKVNDIYQSSLDFIITGKNVEIDDKVAKAFLESNKTGLFFSQLNTDGNIENYDKFEQAFFWICDPFEEEEVQFSKGNYHAGYGKYIDLINMFDCIKDFGDVKSRDASKNEISIEKYTIKCDIDDGLEMSCKTIIDFNSTKDSVQWIRFTLHSKLDIDSITDQQDNNLYWFKPKESATLWVKFTEPLRDSLKYTIRLNYKGQYLTNFPFRGQEWIVLMSSSLWYPRYGNREKAFFDIEYTTPKRYKFCSVGEKKSWEESEDFITSRWVSTRKIRNASFNIGDFFEKIFPSDSISPEVAFYYKTPAQMEAVSEDIRLSLGFFNKIYGEWITDRFYVSEIPGGYGEAFYGMLHLSIYTFIDALDKKGGSHEDFCSHEVSHQWWGVGVDFKSYRDQWLSEGFASYSGLLYTQMSLGDNDAFFKILEDHKKSLMDIRSSWLFSGVKAGPISLGYRNNSEATRGDYQQIVYKKGAWVLHMLRNMLIDFNTMDESIFMAILKEFFQTYKDNWASTEDFIKIVNKHVGFDMSWFFTQWVDHNSIPSYTFGYKTEKTPEGKFKITGRIKQEGVPDNFIMSIPAKIDFGEDSFTIMRLNVTKPYLEFEFPLLPMEPEEIELNILESVLCEIEYDDFEDITP